MSLILVDHHDQPSNLPAQAVRPTTGFEHLQVIRSAVNESDRSVVVDAKRHYDSLPHGRQLSRERFRLEKAVEPSAGFAPRRDLKHSTAEVGRNLRPVIESERQCSPTLGGFSASMSRGASPDARERTISPSAYSATVSPDGSNMCPTRAVRASMIPVSIASRMAFR